MKYVLGLAFLIFSSTLHAQVKAGMIAPEISLPDVQGNTVNLSALKGKIVLVDFWASWCGPCRKANPFVEKLYEKYKSKGFEVFSVSIDSKKEDWLKAIKHDNISYTKVNDADGWNAASAARYGVDAIPATFLLNAQGTIVAVDLEGDALEEKIKNLLAEVKFKKIRAPAQLKILDSVCTPALLLLGDLVIVR